MSQKKQTVQEFLSSLAHPQQDLIDTLRSLILSSDPDLVEGIKWNAPSYSLGGNDIITFNFQTFGCVALIFHTGPKGKDTHTGNRLFKEDGPFISWLADKRFVIKITDLNYLRQNELKIKQTTQKWANLARVHFLTLE